MTRFIRCGPRRSANSAGLRSFCPGTIMKVYPLNRRVSRQGLREKYDVDRGGIRLPESRILHTSAPRIIGRRDDEDIRKEERRREWHRPAAGTGPSWSFEDLLELQQDRFDLAFRDKSFFVEDRTEQTVFLAVHIIIDLLHDGRFQFVNGHEPLVHSDRAESVAELTADAFVAFSSPGMLQRSIRLSGAPEWLSSHHVTGSVIAEKPSTDDIFRSVV